MEGRKNQKPRAKSAKSAERRLSRNIVFIPPKSGETEPSGKPAKPGNPGLAGR
jgi:hypothetical protein